MSMLRILLYCHLCLLGSSTEFEATIVRFIQMVSPSGGPVCPHDPPREIIEGVDALTGCSLACFSRLDCVGFAHNTSPHLCKLYTRRMSDLVDSTSNNCNSFQVNADHIVNKIHKQQ